MNRRSEPVRILIPLYDMESGALSNWLMGVLRRLDRQRFKVDFLLHNPAVGHFTPEALELGARLIPCPDPASLSSYLPKFKRILKEFGPYEVIHANLGNRAFHLMLGKYFGVPGRITHIHSDSVMWARGKGLQPKLKKWFYRFLNPYLIKKYSSAILAVSREAAARTLGGRADSVNDIEILPCGIELSHYQHEVDSVTIRGALNIPESAFVIGHVGRFALEKNHSLLIRIAHEINRSEPNMRLLLVGEGPLRPQIKKEAEQIGIAEKVIFTGLRADVPELLMGAMDVFVFPSQFEGLGLAMIEAQAAGLPCIVSDTIVDTAVLVKSHVQKLSLLSPVSTWAKAILGVKGADVKANRVEAMEIIKDTPLNIDNNVNRLQVLYESYRKSV